ncbi:MULTISPECIES: SAM-dependent methyltransferase [unclassified Corynebacterium]|uniref:THUMP-like domain-containing protein n=1 Tax=unclassified Corynebacterium TaxID=2624378 RepID=UPI0008A1748F|nr:MULTISPECIES: SAM-dependent methyltransferase [unclassified Corynebacterium]OFP36725.1 SAM-dependent methyltransferase [Corynebacterium sp. HMSC071B10]OHF35826.1 SAM-dependent methyltransferase [Corynebacterium sp. HMSC074A01]
MAFHPTEVDYLAANAERIRAIAPELALTKASVFADRARLDAEFGEHARAVSALIAAQRQAAGKFPEWWLTDSDAAQQATPALVAAHRARTLASAGASFVHDVTCSVGSEAPHMVEAGLGWLGSDLSAARLRMARFNLSEDAWLARADALAPASTIAGVSGGVVVADPARRKDGRRITDPAQLEPPLPALVAAYPGAELAIKCAPGIDYAEWEGLVSVVSLDSGVKEACLYTPGIGCGREAVVLRSDGFAETVRGLGDEHASESEEVRDPGEWIIEPDGAIIRAGLVRTWAEKHRLWQLDPHIAFLSGAEIPPGYSGFRVLDAVPLKRLKAALREMDAGAVEILVRGVNVDPDALRKKLKLKGTQQRGVVIARVGDDALAYVCDAREHRPLP